MKARTRTTRSAQVAPAPNTQTKATSSTRGLAKDAFERSTITIRSPPQVYAHPGTQSAHSGAQSYVCPSTPTESTPVKSNSKVILESPLKIKPMNVPTHSTSANTNQTLHTALFMLQKFYQEAIEAEEERVSIDLNTFASIGKLLNTVYEQTPPPPLIKDSPQPAENCTTITAIQQDVDEIKATLKTLVDNMTAGPKPWAEVVASSDNVNIHAEMAKRERLEQAKRERGKLETLISFQDATSTMKEKVEQLTEQELHTLIEEHIHKVKECATIQICRIQKPFKHMVKIQCQHEMDTLALHNIKWSELEGAKLIKPTYGVVINGVAKCDIDPQRAENQEEITKTIEMYNDINIARIEPLMKKLKNPEAPTHSIIIFTECPEEADNLIHEGFKTEKGRLYHAVRYKPQCRMKQCFKCQGYGHKANVCTKDSKCGKCAGDHETYQCKTDKIECIHCKGKHTAWHYECPRRQKEYKRLELLKVTIPPTFTNIQ